MDIINNGLFPIDPSFLESYLHLAIKYTAELKSYTSQPSENTLFHLINDLQKLFLCNSADLVSYNSSLNSIVIQEGKNTRALKKVELDLIFKNFYESYSTRGLTLFFSKGSIRELDIIPLSVDSGITISDVPDFFIILEDAVKLKPYSNHRAQRDFERTLIAQIVQLWWKNFTRPKFIQPSAPDYYDSISTWDPFSTLQELIQWINSNKLIRSNDTDEICLKGKDSAITEIDLDLWLPRNTNLEKTEDEINTDKEKGKQLIYWCQWINSHKDLQLERNPESTNTNAINLESTQQPNQSIKEASLQNWLESQRERKKSIILKRILELRKISADYFKDNLNKVELSRHSLLSFAFNKCLSAKENNSIYSEIKNTSLSDIEFCRLLHGVGTIAQHLYAEQPLTDDGIHRIILMLSHYSHNVLGVPNRIDLRTHLLHAERGEPVLHVLKPFYRDHFFHVLEVCFLGHLLLETKISSKEFLWQLVAKKLGKGTTKTKVLQLWYITSLMHDLGYTMDVLNGSIKFLGLFKHSLALSQLEKSIKKTLETPTDQFKKEIKEILPELDYRDGMERDHGIVGAMHLKSLLETISKEVPSIKVDEYKPAIRAIALHNLRAHSDKICFGKDPIGFLLAICDQLQEWRRPRLTYSTSPNWALSVMDGGNSQLNNLYGSFKKMTTNIKINRGELNLEFSRIKKNILLDINVEYDDSINRNGAVFNNWLDATLNFQRLDFNGLPVDLRISYITPFFNDKNESKRIPQFYRLRDAAHETHMSFLSSWFPGKRVTKGKGRNIISYLTNGVIDYNKTETEETRTEKLTLDLKKLSKQVIVTKDMDAFWDHFKNWKRFNEDRDFPGDYVETIPS